MLVATQIGSLFNSGMAKTKAKDRADRASKLTDEQRMEIELLRKLWYAQPKPHISQFDFGDKYGLGSQGNVGHYLNFRQPLNLKAAIAFAAELRVPVDAFSRRLAKQILLFDHDANDPLTEVIEGIRLLDEDRRQQTLDFIRYQFSGTDEKLFGDGKSLQHYMNMIKTLIAKKK